jgi:uncharacterized protein
MSAAPANDNGKKRAAEGACPICGRLRTAQYHPFCSRRCADVDLHRWLTGGYVLGGREEAEEGQTSDPRAKVSSKDLTTDDE